MAWEYVGNFGGYCYENTERMFNMYVIALGTARIWAKGINVLKECEPCHNTLLSSLVTVHMTLIADVLDSRAQGADVR